MSFDYFNKDILSEDLLSVYVNIEKHYPNIEYFLQLLSQRVYEFSPFIWNKMSKDNTIQMRNRHFLCYSLLISELYESNNDINANNSFLLDGLALDFFWYVYWRHLDNLLDSDLNSPKEEQISSLSQLSLEISWIHDLLFSKYSLPNKEIAKSYVSKTCDISKQEKKQPLDKSRIWERGLLHCLVPVAYFQFCEQKIELLRRYICAKGLIHDIYDVMDDFKKGTQSVPVSWIYELDLCNLFSPENSAKFFIKASQELLLSIEAVHSLNSTSQSTIINVLLEELQKNANNLVSDYA